MNYYLGGPLVLPSGARFAVVPPGNARCESLDDFPPDAAYKPPVKQPKKRYKRGGWFRKYPLQLKNSPPRIAEMEFFE